MGVADGVSYQGALKDWVQCSAYGYKQNEVDRFQMLRTL